MKNQASDPLDDGVLAVTDLEPMARERLPREVWDYLASGAGDQRTLDQNIEAWQSPPFAPKVMMGLVAIDTSIALLGRSLPHPILFAPTALQTNYHPDGEAATMRAAAASPVSLKGWLPWKRRLIALSKKPGAILVTPTPRGPSSARRLSP